MIDVIKYPGFFYGFFKWNYTQFFRTINIHIYLVISIVLTIPIVSIFLMQNID